MILHVQKDRETNNRLSSRYDIPKRTLQNWSLRELEMKGWQGELYRNLKVYDLLELQTLKDLKKIFKSNELKALIASINGTLPSVDFFTTKELWSYHFQDSCIYEGMQIEQFTDGDSLDMLKDSVSNKLSKLDMFSKYVLMLFCYRFWESDNKNLDEYLEK